MSFSAWLLFSLTSAATPLLQQGDQEGEVQNPVDRQWSIPAAPPRTPSEALELFHLPQGYSIEAVATEPLIQDPVDCCWDAAGRLWVVEMPTFMPNADGIGELEPKSSIAILTDTDGDGLFDQRTTFLEDLILPRSICLVPGGVVVILPPEIVYLEDNNGDGLPDSRQVLSDQVQSGLTNPEHAANSLTLGIDNWLYVANHSQRYRQVNGSWISEPCASGGQWGMSQDDWGRMAFNYNSSCVHVNWVSPSSVLQNEVFRGRGTNKSTGASREVFPSRINPGVNRGYRKGTLREDGSLAHLTGACGPAWFTGTALASADRGRLFQCEPCANVVQRYEVTTDDGKVQAQLMGNPKDLDFLTSTDERFRPVNLRIGPDGSLYVVDLYRGILQHRVFLTSFLRRQAEERELVQPHGLGRIWRIRHEDGVIVDSINLSTASDEQLVETLGHSNAWQRRTAQRLLLERSLSEQTVLALKAIAFEHPPSATTSPNEMQRVHALWTLEGKNEIGAADVLQAYVGHGSSSWKAQLLKAGTPLFADSTFVQKVAAISLPQSRELRWQMAFCLAQSSSPTSLSLLLKLFQSDPSDAILRDAVISSLGSREHHAILRLQVLSQESEAQIAFLHDLAKCTMLRHIETDCVALMETMDPNTWQGKAVWRGLAAGLPKREGNMDYQFSGPPPTHLAQLTDASLTEKFQRLLLWNQSPNPEGLTHDVPPSQEKPGQALYEATCAACHQLDGTGLQGLAPPLAGSEWLSLSDEELATIVLKGLGGPIKVAGNDYNLNMPGWSSMSDANLADILTYVCQQWAEEPRVVLPSTVAATRKTMTTE
mgnify:CR=1 FL=1